MQPSAYRSEAVPVSRPSACSGDQYSGVPINVPAAVSEPPLRATRASPKSVVTTRPVSLLDQDVRRGQIAMHDTLRVRVGERLRDRRRIPRSLADIERQARERRVGQIAAVDVLHHEKRLLPVVHVVVHPDDVFVREPGESFRLPLEPAPLLHRRTRRSAGEA